MANYRFNKKDLIRIADNQYKWGISRIERKDFYELWKEAAITAFANAWHLYQMAEEDLSANLCRTNIIGLTQSQEERDEAYLTSERHIAQILKTIEELAKSA